MRTRDEIRAAIVHVMNELNEAAANAEYENQQSLAERIMRRRSILRKNLIIMALEDKGLR